MNPGRYYLTSDDVRNQQRINRAVTELVDPAPVVSRRRIPAASPSDPWHCDITEENDSIAVTIHASSAADDYFSVIFRGNTYRVDSETFMLSAGDLDRNVYIYLIKTVYNPIRFLLATSHNYDADSFSAGSVRIATIIRQDGEVKAFMERDRMFEWPDAYPEAGKFAADLIFTGIIHNDDEPQPIPFYDFIDTAEQKLMIHNNYAMIINGRYIIGTAIRDSDTGDAGYTLISIRPEGHETDALQVFWTAGIDYTNQIFGLTNIHYELITDDEYPYMVHGGMIRIPVVALTESGPYRPVRLIDHTRGAPNFPEIAINPIGQSADAELSSWVYIDRTSQTVRLRIRYSMDGGAELPCRINVPFSSFTGASRSALCICSYYNISSHIWSDVWFTLEGTEITTKPTPPGGSDNRQHSIELAYISYNAADNCPYVIGQNCTRTAQFSSAVWRFDEFAGLIANLDQRVTALEQQLRRNYV